MMTKMKPKRIHVDIFRWKAMWKVFLSLLIYVNVINWDNLLYVWVLQNVLLQMQMKFILLWIGGNEWSVIYLILFISDWPDCLKCFVMYLLIYKTMARCCCCCCYRWLRWQTHDVGGDGMNAFSIIFFFNGDCNCYVGKNDKDDCFRF